MKYGGKYLTAACCCAVLFIVITYSLSLGTIKINYTDTLIILKNIVQQNLNNNILEDVIYYLRLPRFIMALIIGCGLAVTGTVMQAVMKNPLADPYLLGISSGAGLGAILAIILGITTVYGLDCVGLFAFCGAIATTIFILLVSAYCGKSNTLTILLSGMAINAVCSALISLSISVYADTEKIQSVTYWLMGSLLNANWQSISYLLVVVGGLTIFFLTRRRILNLMLLGDDVSITLGHNLSKSRQLYIMLCALIVGFIVYNSGIIGFVGLVVPHIGRLLVGNNHYKLLPLSAVLGAAVLAWADVISRIVIDGAEVPIGIVVAVLGSPVFVYLLLNRRYGYGK